MGISLDRPGIIVALVLGAALAGPPFMTLRANRIASGKGVALFDALPWGAAAGIVALAVIVGGVALLARRPLARLGAAVIGGGVGMLAVGWAAEGLTQAGNPYARIAPAGGFWLLVLACLLLGTDALVRLRPGPLARLLALGALFGALGLLLASGQWDGVSVLKEYANRADAFWREARTHLALALGAVAVACAVGLPLGVLCHRVAWLRGMVLQGLTIIQTIPSIALFGILMAPLGWLAAHVPAIAALGVRGIGATPALVALILYALLPVVANTVVGLAQVPAATVDAARGMGMGRGRLLREVELPLALPVILTGVRIVLVQAIGLTTVAALIGGGGFGTFVFQGVGQAAMDLVLLGALPTVALAFGAAVILDALIEGARRGGGAPTPGVGRR
ncbi:ABC transporter permease [Rhodospirillum rubrum]|uniref:Binding-protein-dependent transport systems inner membrane component n=1 Tax=Rhodospirillum rubrum (strain ATCC 11170 / ATH 1.1.1 / DSM 467 / LMG 4362 / NCIMB 8255 / S1) TaxID=269796 RepID=Q2RRR1_RHORT|nr:ABC transporter permease [Rhodospirillum rubrum]ABC23184.1 Binding-protein-dependent transport systems inner membrane component [Rhodospirillum rubrum ATCC 11170]AEO48915.1 binding-protein dependent transport system inner membrane protein [Rhodospirillum rubrum F11]MBK5954824.1 ABC transporter permease [Rhodospirillum rubrum]QXG79163.1 ABC transporter permease [Rhodospirillum rubrum]HAP98522.1 ABC transporter permease [Rhodospirillum rubrum]